MSIAAIGNHTPASAAAALTYSSPESMGLPTAAGSRQTQAPTADDVKKAAGQFEAIIIRQLLAPSIEPIMSGGLGGESGGAGGGMYGYMLTDVLANNLAEGGGLGLARLLEKQLSTQPLSAPRASNTLL